MVEPTHPEADRDKAIDDWDKSVTKTHAPAVARDIGKLRTGLIFAAVAAAAMGGAYWLQHGGPDKSGAGEAGRDELALAQRKAVPKLKEPEAPQTAPAPAPAAAVEEDPLRKQREQLELQRQERERQLLEARRKSSIFPIETDSEGPRPDAPPGATPAVAAALAKEGKAEHGANDANSRFARAVTGSAVPVRDASRIEHLEYRILQGKGIQAVLEPRAISDLPGLLRATVQQDVYGEQGREKLLPWGTRLSGVYNADVRNGQERLFVVWNRAVRPDGVAVTLDSAGADQLGTAGMGGEVDKHFAQIFGTSVLLSIIGAGAATVGVSPSDQYNSTASYRQAVHEAAAQTSEQALGAYINIPPTLTVAPGSRIHVFVNRDLDFTPLYQGEIDAQQRASSGDTSGGVLGE